VSSEVADEDSNYVPAGNAAGKVLEVNEISVRRSGFDIAVLDLLAASRAIAGHSGRLCHRLLALTRTTNDTV
jgi:hypothetical protein